MFSIVLNRHQVKSPLGSRHNNRLLLCALHRIPNSNRRKVAGEPKIADPYESDDTSVTLLPVLVALGAFIPLVFCLCRL